MRRPLLIAPALLVLLVAGCGQQETPAEPAATGTVTASPTESSSPSPSESAPTVDVREDDAQAGAAFATPTGNITCFIESGEADGAEGPAAGCIIGQKSWTAPTSDCALDYGSIISIHGAERALFDCRGDIPTCFSPLVAMPDLCGQDADGQWWHRSTDPTVTLSSDALGNGKAVVLPYGTAVRIGSVQCTSAKTGVTCQNTDSGHGFRLSRTSYSLTP